jgi:hypothetical protein
LYLHEQNNTRANEWQHSKVISPIEKFTFQSKRNIEFILRFSQNSLSASRNLYKYLMYSVGILLWGLVSEVLLLSSFFGLISLSFLIKIHSKASVLLQMPFFHIAIGIKQ